MCRAVPPRFPGVAHPVLCLAADVFFNVHGGISVLSRSIGGWTPCLNSTMMNALVHFVLDGLQLHDIHPASHQAPGGAQAQRPKLRVLWALRSNRAAYQQQVLAQLQQRLPSESNAEVCAPSRSFQRACPAGAATAATAGPP